MTVKCCLCDKEVEDKFSNNALPVQDGRCCMECNLRLVVPARAVISKKTRFLEDVQKRERCPIGGDAPDCAGVYVVWERGIEDPLYVGETANIKARMVDIKNTWNHSLRKKLALKEFGIKLVSGKFPDDVEKRLDDFMRDSISVSYFPVSFGRKEFEEATIAHYPNMLNSPSLRGKK